MNHEQNNIANTSGYNGLSEREVELCIFSEVLRCKQRYFNIKGLIIRTVKCMRLLKLV